MCLHIVLCLKNIIIITTNITNKQQFQYMVTTGNRTDVRRLVLQRGRKMNNLSFNNNINNTIQF